MQQSAEKNKPAKRENTQHQAYNSNKAKPLNRKQLRETKRNLWS